MSYMNDIVIWNREEDTTSEIGTNCTEENGPTRAASKWGNGLEVTNYLGTQRRVVHASFSYTDTIMFDFTYTPNLASSSLSNPFQIHVEPAAGQGTDGDIRILFTGSTEQWRIQHYKSGQQNNSYAATSFPADVPLHIRAILSQTAKSVLGGDKIGFFLNGTRLTLASGDETNALAGNTSGKLSVGNISYVDRGMQGILDNLKVYSGANIDISNDFNNEGFGGRKRRTG